jgi:hypothetical protein
MRITMNNITFPLKPMLPESGRPFRGVVKLTRPAAIPSHSGRKTALQSARCSHGREHLGQTGGQSNPSSAPDAFTGFHSASLELDHQAQIIPYEGYYPYGSTPYQAVRSQAETPERY